MFYKSFQFLIISPTWQYKFYKINFVDKEYWKTKDDDILSIIDIIYSLLLYIIFLAGLFHSKKFLNKKLWLLLVSICLYYYLLLGWTGVGRYNLPIICLSSIYFSFGISYLKDNLIKKFVK